MQEIILKNNIRINGNQAVHDLVLSEFVTSLNGASHVHLYLLVAASK
jgi:hypothetical protein